MAKFDVGDVHWYSALAAHEYSSRFGFGCGVHDVLDSVAHEVERCISHGVCDCGWVLVKDVPSSGSTAGFGKDEV